MWHAAMRTRFARPGTAMGRQGLTAPKPAAEIQAILRRKRETKLKADRATVYRILDGEARRPVVFPLCV